MRLFNRSKVKVISPTICRHAVSIILASCLRMLVAKPAQYIAAIVVAMVAIGVLMPGFAFADGPAYADSTPQRIVIPSIGLDSAVEPVGYQIHSQNGTLYREWNTSQNLVGWHNLSAPVGQVGNTVLAGHSDVFTRIFRDLPQVERGNKILLYANGEARQYIVDEIREVKEFGASLAQRIENGRLINPTNDERLTLITCNRPGATHRLVIIARPLPVNDSPQIDLFSHPAMK